MPSLTFVLPHWLYWTILALFPLIAIYLVRRQAARPDGRPTYFLAYLFLVTAGFVGMHRFYLKNGWGFVFIPVFLIILWTNAHVRDAREDVSHTRSDYESAERMVNKAKTEVSRQQEDAEEHLKKAQEESNQAKSGYLAAQAERGSADLYARIAAGVMGLMLLVDALLLPGLVRRTRAREPLPPPPLPAHPMETAIPDASLPAPQVKGIGLIDTLSRTVGEFIAYWAVLAVFAYYYEVIGRYVFNSPTNWVHESMFLMFGMQYMLAGAYAYRDDTHVRVDIIYNKFSVRGRAICDLITSFFFFLFAGVMLYSGWRFAADAVSLRESSFTEWGIQYWPVKLTIPIGAALLLLQGISRLVRDIKIVFQKAG
ncbi:MAG TPA: TRAP transporter small permease subunit [Dongiaceae bacterium]|jgi:TRAP-type mannitol/chloroaromatic compound transport system permease small subunit|nr:TRAP transporter small permease subunit [Dongiaceae bacterium]